MAKPFSNYASANGRGAYEFGKSPEGRANDASRYQRRLANTMQRGEDRVAQIAALKSLAQGVPPEVLPAGGIHSGMSPQDVQAATDRINQFRSQRGTAGPVGARVPDGSTGTMSGHASQPQSEAPQTRRTPTGGTETLVQSQSGPRWVASTDRVPPITGTPMERQPQQMQPVDQKALIDGARGNYDALLAVNRRLAAPGGMMEPVGRPYQMPSDTVNPAAVAGAGTGRNVAGGPTGYGTAYSLPAGAAPQPRAVAGISPASARNDINTGGNAPSAPMIAASTPASGPTVPPPMSNPSGRPDGPVPVPPVPAAYAAGQAIRAVPGAVGGAYDAAARAGAAVGNKVADAGRQLYQGITGAPSTTAGTRAPYQSPTDLRTSPSVAARPPMPDIGRAWPTNGAASAAAQVPRPAPSATVAPPIINPAPSPLQGNDILPRVPTGPTASTEDEEERRRRMAAGARQPFQYQ